MLQEFGFVPEKKIEEAKPFLFNENYNEVKKIKDSFKYSLLPPKGNQKGNEKGNVGEIQKGNKKGEHRGHKTELKEEIKKK